MNANNYFKKRYILCEAKGVLKLSLVKRRHACRYIHGSLTQYVDTLKTKQRTTHHTNATHRIVPGMDALLSKHNGFYP